MGKEVKSIQSSACLGSDPILHHLLDVSYVKWDDNNNINHIVL